MGLNPFGNRIAGFCFPWISNVLMESNTAVVENNAKRRVLADDVYAPGPDADNESARSPGEYRKSRKSIPTTASLMLAVVVNRLKASAASSSPEPGIAALYPRRSRATMFG